MFSGLVETATRVARIESEQQGIRLVLDRPSSFDDIRLGDSIATNGCCLTVVECDARTMSFQAGQETLSKTTLGTLQPGAMVNCERSLILGDRLGGHWVTGHIDGVGSLVERTDNADWSDMTFHCPEHLLRQMAAKGSVAIDGVSLTIVQVSEEAFSVALIPHTLAQTTLGRLTTGNRVNIETDLIAKYVQRQLEPR